MVYSITKSEDFTEEQRQSTFCLVTAVTTAAPTLPDAQQFSSFSEPMKATVRYLHGLSATPGETPTPTSQP